MPSNDNLILKLYTL